jgi:hypothetical protein
MWRRELRWCIVVFSALHFFSWIFHLLVDSCPQSLLNRLLPLLLSSSRITCHRCSAPVILLPYSVFLIFTLTLLFCDVPSPHSPLFSLTARQPYTVPSQNPSFSAFEVIDCFSSLSHDLIGPCLDSTTLTTHKTTSATRQCPFFVVILLDSCLPHPRGAGSRSL